MANHEDASLRERTRERQREILAAPLVVASDEPDESSEEEEGVTPPLLQELGTIRGVHARDLFAALTRYS